MRVTPLPVILSGWCLLIALPLSGQAATFTVNLDGYGASAGPPQAWQPLPGLFAAMTAERDFTYYSKGLVGEPPVWEIREGNGVARAAAYGSDTSVQGGVLDPRMNGFAVEPMADAAAAVAYYGCTRNDSPSICGGLALSAAATARVDHRIVPRDPTDIPVAAGEQVPVILDYALHASTSAPQWNEGFGDDDYPPPQSLAGFSVLNGDHLLFGRRTCSIAGLHNCTSIGSEGGSWNAALDYATVDRPTTYTIAVLATAFAVSKGISSHTAFAEAVADPFLRIDPGWPYASYFMVQQESALHPGEWVEVSRVWMQPVPEPATLALFTVGLLAVAGAALQQRGSSTTARG